MHGPERRKALRDTDRYRETTNRAARVIDEARLIRLEIGTEGVPETEVGLLREMVERQIARYPNRPSDHPKTQHK